MQKGSIIIIYHMVVVVGIVADMVADSIPEEVVQEGKVQGKGGKDRALPDILLIKNTAILLRPLIEQVFWLITCE